MIDIFDVQALKTYIVFFYKNQTLVSSKAYYNHSKWHIKQWQKNLVMQCNLVIQ